MMDKKNLDGSERFIPPVTPADAERRAQDLLRLMSDEEKFEIVRGGGFYIKENDRLGIPRVVMSDATQGLHLREAYPSAIDRSVAFPCAAQLAATWNRALAAEYARAIGEECRAGGIHILLGPGVNVYRSARCGRNFEYFGEDPYLASQMVRRYVVGLQETGVMATVKHFVCNNMEWVRRASNSIVDRRALHEIYLPAFKAAVEAGVMALMTAYNYVNGEYCGQHKALITHLLRDELGFEWLVMTDWNSVSDGVKVAESGMDLEMPFGKVLAESEEELLGSEAVDRMVESILKSCIAMGFYDRPQAVEGDDWQEAHERVALQTAREGIVLLKNDGMLPLDEPDAGYVLITGLRAETEKLIGKGSGRVEGYDHASYLRALMERVGPERVLHRRVPTDEEIAQAEAVIVCPGFIDESEASDRDFALSEAQNQLIERCVAQNAKTVVAITAGGGIAMPWNERAGAVVHVFYGGQRGAEALMDVLFGTVNPSGKLPFTIERRFEDSPASDDIDPDYEYYTERYELGGHQPIDPSEEAFEKKWPYPITYDHGVFVGYRWYEKEAIDVLYCFGHGLSYTTFEYEELAIEEKGRRWDVSLTVCNTGQREGREVVQLYVQPDRPTVERPVKELKGFEKLSLAAGEHATVRFSVAEDDLAYYDPEQGVWVAEPGPYTIHVGRSLEDIRLRDAIELS